MSHAENIKIRLGPVVYHTKRSVLLSAGGSMLAAMFSHDNDMEPSNVDEDGAYIIHDRSPYLFGYILRFLENSGDEPSIETSSTDDGSSTEDDSSSTENSMLKELSMKSLETLQVEVDYYQIAGLQGEIKNEMGLRKQESRKLKKIQDLEKQRKKQIRDLETRWANRQQYETSDNGCLIELKDAKEGDHIIVEAGVLHEGVIKIVSKGVIKAISTTIRREATVEWKRPNEQLLIACLVFLVLPIIIMGATGLMPERRCEYVSKDQDSYFVRETQNLMVILVFAATVFAIGATVYDVYLKPVHYTTRPEINDL
jgi:hypothetical protein